MLRVGPTARTVVLASLVVSIPCAQSGAQQVQLSDLIKSRVFTEDVTTYLKQGPVPQVPNTEPSRWATTLEYRKISICEHVLQYIRSNDLDATTASRCILSLNLLTGHRFPEFGPNITAKDREALYREASEVVNQFRIRTIKEVAKREKNDRKAELAIKYRSQIIPGRSDGVQMVRSQAMLEELLSEWFPIGRLVSDLQEIVGHPGKKFEGEIRYPFELGGGRTGGVVYIFKVKDGIITTVHISGLS